MTGDTISPKLFTATMESIFRRLNLENEGVNIDGEFLTNIRFAEDTFLYTETSKDKYDTTASRKKQDKEKQ